MDEVDEEDHRDMLHLTLELHDNIVQSDLDGDVVNPDHDDAPHKVAPTKYPFFQVTVALFLDACIIHSLFTVD